jgi:hypothetical protein
LLLVAAALLTASMHSLGVVEAPVAPAPATVLVVAGSAPVRHASGPDVRRAEPARVDTILHASGRAWLDALAAARPVTLRAADVDSRVAATAMDDPPSARDVTAWWTALTPATRTVLADDAPVVVGNLDGVPYDVRDAANRAVLAARLADPDAPTALTAMLGQVRESLVRGPGDPRK